MIKAEHSWLPPKTNLKLSSNDVHVWRAALDQPLARVQELAGILSDDERMRAVRFHFKRDGRRFIASHGILRSILGRYLNVEPRQLRFRYGPHGKPYLKEGFSDSDLRFNLAHSNDLALYAVAMAKEVGVDLERINREIEYEQVAKRFFSPIERETLQTQPVELRPDSFFVVWTRKEAYVKAKGEGLSLPLGSFDVSLAPEEPAELLRVRNNPQEAPRWSLQDLNPGGDYKAALAVEGHEWQLACWEWRG
jgi:4'-phosphopantetheinyl transferase